MDSDDFLRYSLILTCIGKVIPFQDTCRSRCHQAVAHEESVENNHDEAQRESPVRHCDYIGIMDVRLFDNGVLVGGIHVI